MMRRKLFMLCCASICLLSFGVMKVCAEEGWLTPLRVAASSTLEGGNYQVENICDNNMSTAWVEGVGGHGIDQFVDFFYEPGTIVTGGMIIPGYYQDEDTFWKNSAPIEISVMSQGVSADVDVSDLAISYNEQMQGYEFTFLNPIVCDMEYGTLRVTIKKVRAGSVYEDTCISELHFFGGVGKSADISENSNKDTVEKYIEKIQLDGLGDSSKLRFLCEIDNKEYLLDEKGRILSEGFDGIDNFSYNHKTIIAWNEGEYYAISIDGERITDSAYSYLEGNELCCGIALTEDGKYVVIDYDGTCILTCDNKPEILGDEENRYIVYEKEKKYQIYKFSGFPIELEYREPKNVVPQDSLGCFILYYDNGIALYPYSKQGNNNAEAPKYKKIISLEDPDSETNIWLLQQHKEGGWLILHDGKGLVRDRLTIKDISEARLIGETIEYKDSQGKVGYFDIYGNILDNPNKNTVEKVEVRVDVKDSTFYPVVYGLDGSGNKVWTYDCTVTPAVQLTTAEVYENNGKAYVLEPGRLIILDKQTGEVESVSELNIGGSPTACFDNDGRIYFIGYFTHIAYCCNGDGSLVWSSDLSDYDLSWSVCGGIVGDRLIIENEGFDAGIGKTESVLLDVEGGSVLDEEDDQYPETDVIEQPDLFENENDDRFQGNYITKYDSKSYDDFEYIEINDRGLAIIKYLGNSTTVNIPSTIDGKNVLYLFDNAFEGCQSIKHVDLPEGLKGIGSSCFNRCINLEDIVIPESVTALYGSSFSYCENLKYANIKGKLKELGGILDDDIFYGCNSLQEVVLAYGIKSIPDGMFGYCYNLEKVVLPETIETIGERAFTECSKLTEISIPNTVVEIGDNAFAGCKSLKIIELPEGISRIGRSTFSMCSSLKTIAIPDQVTIIDAEAFYYCDRLEEVTMNENVRTIGNSAFMGCDNLFRITIPKSVREFGEDVFRSCDNLRLLSVKDNGYVKMILDNESIFYSHGFENDLFYGDPVDSDNVGIIVGTSFDDSQFNHTPKEIRDLSMQTFYIKPERCDCYVDVNNHVINIHLYDIEEGYYGEDIKRNFEWYIINLETGVGEDLNRNVIDLSKDFGPGSSASTYNLEEVWDLTPLEAASLLGFEPVDSVYTYYVMPKYIMSLKNDKGTRFIFSDYNSDVKQSFNFSTGNDKYSVVGVRRGQNFKEAIEKLKQNGFHEVENDFYETEGDVGPFFADGKGHYLRVMEHDNQVVSWEYWGKEYKFRERIS